MPDAAPLDRRPSSTVWWLALGRFPATTATRMLAPLLGVIAAGVGVSLVTAGAILAVFEMAGFTAPLAGLLVDRLGARRTLVHSLSVFAVAALGIAAAPNGVALAIALVVLGLGSNVYEAGSVVWLAHATLFRERAAWMGRYELSWAGGLLIGVPVAGVISLASWRFAFVGLAALALGARVVLPGRLDVAAIDTAIDADALVDEGAHGGAPKAFAESPGRRVHWARVVAVFVGLRVLCGASQLVIVVYGVWLEARFGLTTAAIGAVGFVLGTGDLVANLANVRFTDRIGKARSSALGAAVLVASALVLSTLSGHLPAAVVALVALIIGFEFALLSSKPLLTELGWSRRGMGIGIGFASAALCRSICAIVGTALYEAHGLPGAALASAVAAAIAGTVFLVGVREPVHDAPPASVVSAGE